MINSTKRLMPKKTRKLMARFFGCKTCDSTGFLYQMVGQYKVYLRNRNEYLSVESLNKLCEQF